MYLQSLNYLILSLLVFVLRAVCAGARFLCLSRMVSCNGGICTHSVGCAAILLTIAYVFYPVVFPSCELTDAVLASLNVSLSAR